ncbi:hypothetical protein [Flagellimonas maritima]|nr:hypothetical protein [Allomuricauda aurantiaca]
MNIALTVGKENDILTLTDTQNRIARIVGIDIRVSNGILHIINSVLLGLGEPSPGQGPTLYEIIASHPDLKILPQLLKNYPM